MAVINNVSDTKEKIKYLEIIHYMYPCRPLPKRGSSLRDILLCKFPLGLDNSGKYYIVEDGDRYYYYSKDLDIRRY